MSTFPYTWPSKLRVGPVFRKSAGIPGVAVLVCASKRGARSGDEHLSRTPGLASVHLAYQVASRACVSEISGHSGCCSPGLCEQKRSQDGWDVLSRTPGLASCESGMCFGNQRAFRVLQSWSVRAKGQDGLARKLRVQEHVFRKSAGIPGVAVLVCASKRPGRTL